jgi:hypothetical protein
MSAVAAGGKEHSPFPVALPAMATDSLQCNKIIAAPFFVGDTLAICTEPLFILVKID